MHKKTLAYIFCLFLPLTAIAESQHPVSTHDKFAQVREQFESRWKSFQERRVFAPFVPEKSDGLLESDFKKIREIRKSVWETPGYERAEYLLEADLVRIPHCIAFAYNNTVPSYNASTISLADKYCIACEGPREKDVKSFFHLLRGHQVTHLVRLTGSHEGLLNKCHPYWKGLSHRSSDGRSYLNIPVGDAFYTVRSFDMAYWRDNQGVDPKRLLAVVLEVKKELTLSSGLLTVHCSAGVGRTGTFLAALRIVDAIDRGEPFSIEEIVYRLSLQRVSTVATALQYITLHRLAELYLETTFAKA